MRGLVRNPIDAAILQLIVDIQLEGSTVSTEQNENGTDVSLETKTLKSNTQKLDALIWMLIRWWGFIFRALFICAIGVIGNFLINPQSIIDVPLSQLNLKQIFGNIFALLIVLGCVRWFFEFPEKGSGNVPEDNPYVGWGQFGGFAIIVATLAIYWASK